MKAVYFSAKLPHLAEVRDIDVPEPGDDEILVKNVAVASNPKDWKLPFWFKDWEGVEGNDIAGYVQKVGKNVQEFKPNQRVAAFTKMRTHTKYGAYAEYSVSPASTAWPLADGTPFEEAATLPLAVMTAALGLFKRLALQEPPSGGLGNAAGVVVINGASSSVGAFAVQLAKRAGFTVVGIAGESGDYVKALGADAVIDYRGKTSEALGSEVKSQIAESGKDLVGIFDAVSTDNTVEMLARFVLGAEGGKITTVLPVKFEKPGVEILQTNVGSAYQADSEWSTKWYRQIGIWLDDGSFQANRVKIMPHGLDSVAEGVHLLKDNKVHAEKLVYRIRDTEGISSA